MQFSKCAFLLTDNFIWFAVKFLIISCLLLVLGPEIWWVCEWGHLSGSLSIIWNCCVMIFWICVLEEWIGGFFWWEEIFYKFFFELAREILVTLVHDFQSFLSKTQTILPKIFLITKSLPVLYKEIIKSYNFPEWKSCHTPSNNFTLKKTTWNPTKTLRK